MKAMVSTSKFKTSEYMKEGVKAEKEFLADMGKELKNCKGGILLTHSDGTCLAISLWDSEEAANELMNNSKAKVFMDSFEGKLEDEPKVEFFDVSLKLEM